MLILIESIYINILAPVNIPHIILLSFVKGCRTYIEIIVIITNNINLKGIVIYVKNVNNKENIKLFNIS
jgi:hypothetical protein